MRAVVAHKNNSSGSKSHASKTPIKDTPKKRPASSHAQQKTASKKSPEGKVSSKPKSDNTTATPSGTTTISDITSDTIPPNKRTVIKLEAKYGVNEKTLVVIGSHSGYAAA